jgi:hypothetical protein
LFRGCVINLEVIPSIRVQSLRSIATITLNGLNSIAGLY